MQRLTLLAATVVMESLPMMVFAAVVGKLPGNHAETPSAWGVLGLMVLALVTRRWLARQGFSSRWRWLWAVVLTIVVVQVVARLDLSESLRLWDFGWLGELADPDGVAFRKFGGLDHLVAGFLLVVIWFRGALLANSNPEDRRLGPPIALAAVIFAAGFIGGDDLGVEGTVRVAAIAYIVVVLAVIAFRAAGRGSGGDAGSFRAMSLSFAATLVLVWAAMAIFMLVVLLIIAGVAGTGVAEPVLQVLGDGLRVVVTGIAYLFWPLIWLFDQVRGEPNPADTEIALITIEGIGDPSEIEDFDEINASSSAGALLVRVFGAIGLVVVFAILVTLLFRRLSTRNEEEDEERDSLWSEAHLRDDFWGTLRNLRDRFLTRSPRPHSNDAAIAQLYFEVLEDAERRGLARPVARTPLQFARALRSQYGSSVPVEISEQFSGLRYADQAPSRAEVDRLQRDWRALKELPR